MNRLIRSPFSSLFIIALSSWILTSCLDGFCAEDYEKSESRLYTVDLRGTRNALEDEWAEYEYRARWYGKDENQHLLYYTKDYIYSPEEIIRLDYKSKTKNSVVIDEDGFEFSLSPNGQYFAFQKYVSEGTELLIVSTTDTTKFQAPRDSSIGSILSFKWTSDSELVYYTLGDNSSTKLYRANIETSSLTPISDDIDITLWNLDISVNSNIIVYNSDVVDDNGSIISSIFLLNLGTDNSIFISEGYYPRLVPFHEKLIFETFDGIWVSDFNGNTELVFAHDNFYSDKKNLDIAPNGKSIVISNYDGIFIIDLETKEVTQLTDKSDFFDSKGDWESINSSFKSPMFSADGNKIFFAITLRYFDDGC